MLNPYIGHPSQLCGAEEVRLVGGKGDGMRLLNLWNAAGLYLTVAADRCADIYRLRLGGDNLGYFSPCGYVGPSFYQEPEKGFLKSFTAGFLTTCGLNNAGGPSDCDGERVPLHGTIGNTPCEAFWWEEDGESMIVHASVRDQTLFGRKLMLRRTLRIGKFENVITLTDTVENQGDRAEPVLLMYHMNMGYPLLSERAQVDSNASRVVLGDAAVPEETWKRIDPPRPRTREICYRHLFEDRERAAVSIRNPEIGKGLQIAFDPKEFPCLIQWSLFSERDYALGLEPRNFPEGPKAKAKEKGQLHVLQPGESRSYHVEVKLWETGEA